MSGVCNTLLVAKTPAEAVQELHENVGPKEAASILLLVLASSWRARLTTGNCSCQLLPSFRGLLCFWPPQPRELTHILLAAAVAGCLCAMAAAASS